jgi:predicted phage terminase large subunit-like protein
MSSSLSLKNLLADPQSLRRQLLAEKCRRSLAEFIRHGWHVLESTTPLEWNWHVDAIADHVQAALDDWAARQIDPEHVQRIRNLLINIPPGTAKSRIVSVFTPAWMWIKSPTWRAIFLSANPRVAMRDSVYCRDVIESDWYRTWFEPKWTLAEDQNAKGLYRNTLGGYRQAIGIRAKITGDRADALFVDDPHDAEEVYSDALRQEVIDRWDGAICNRVNDLRSSVRIGIMQRLHESDWSGHILKSGEWEHLMIPQEFEAAHARTTAIGWRDPRTEEGELLFPTRFPAEVLRAEKDRLGSMGYAGQHQQRPVPAEGGMFKAAWFRSYMIDTTVCPQCKGKQPARSNDPPCGYCAGEGHIERYVLRFKTSGDKPVNAPDCRRFGTVDLAFSTRKEADYTVIAAWAVTPHSELILLDLERARLEGPDILPAIERMKDRHNLSYIGIEDVSAQLLVVQAARRAGLTVRGLKADRDKVSRAVPATIRMEGELIFFPERATWRHDLESELLTFPRGAHDDMVDVLAYAALEVQARGGAGPSEAERRAKQEAERLRAEEKQRDWMNPMNPAFYR